MTKVYHLKERKRLKEVTKKRLEGVYSPSSKVLVKIHFGEPGNKTAFTPERVKPILEAMRELELEPVLIDTPTAYNSPRGTVEGYKEVVRKRGYESLAPFIISNRGVEVKMKDFTAEVCKELTEASNVLVLTHVKGHACSGFGGAIKNLGMGGVTKETKALEHDLAKPKFVGECAGCGICADLCPAGAIKMEKGKAVLRNNICWGCSICEVSCPEKALEPEGALFDDLLAQGASAVINNLKNAYFINVLDNITKWCDCEVDPGEKVAEEAGVLFSRSPVAIDRASVEVIRENEGREVFLEENSKDPLLHVGFASKYTGLDMSYELGEI